MNPSSAADTYNLAVGHNAGISVTTGIQNTVIGGLAGDALTTGSNNIIIGYNATASAVDVSNEVTIGDSNIANVRIPADSTLKIGASGDLQLEHLSSNSFIKNTAVGDLYIEKQVDNKDIIDFFILPPSIKELKKRLIKRGRDKKDDIDLRLSYAIKEISHYKEYSYVLINQNVQQTVSEIINIIKTNLIISKNKKLTEKKIKSLINF